MDRFNNGQKKRIELGDGDWVEIPAVISFATAEEMAMAGNDPVAIIKSIVLDWNLKDGETKAEITEDTLKKLDINVIRKIQEAITELVNLPKV